MDDSVRGQVKKFRDLRELSEAAAADISRLIAATVAGKGHFSLALSGGNSPRILHNLLGTVYREKIPWESVSVYFGDERYVPHSDKASNYLMARETLLNLVPIPVGNIHPIPTDLANPERAAAEYEKELRKEIPAEENSFDLVLLGMGKEGHTASLFPDSPALDEARRWALSVEVPAVPHERITLTYPVLNRAAAIYFLVSGADKKDALREVLNEESNYHAYPARGIRPVRGRLEWWVDAAASID
jgi:6-phosphogluconolactonase